ncbi:hypothetical protein CRENBAI_005480 [Crenichthys baileyi]|uniref:Uncharacterized protein n=1 Tax=Crenichthys baileyi TaxID=28760 RepID=A0AAV9S6K0_9TELE
MAQKRQMTALEALEEINRLSNIDIVDFSDTPVDFDEEEDEQLFPFDPIHDQEDAGPSGAAKTLPPTASVEAVSSSSSENGAEEDEMYQPPARQLWSASRPVKRKVGSATKKGSTSTRPVSRRASRVAPSPSDNSEDMWHSPGWLESKRKVKHQMREIADRCVKLLSAGKRPPTEILYRERTLTPLTLKIMCLHLDKHMSSLWTISTSCCQGMSFLR